MLKVLTQNLYLGADFAPLFSAPASAIPALRGRVWDEVRASDFPRRAELLADLICADAPDLIGLQEAALWRAGPEGRVAFDFVELFRDALRRRGLGYDPVAVATGHDGAGRTAAGEEVRFTDREAILARSDPPRFAFENAAAGAFDNCLSVKVGDRRVNIVRGWASINVRAPGGVYRFVSTHLEAYDRNVRESQTRELLAGPLVTDLPTLMVGDLNGGPDLLLAAGFRDAGPAVADRIDYVLYRGAWVPEGARLIDTHRGGAWASDHPGVLAVLSPPGEPRA